MKRFTTERLVVEDWTPHLGNEVRRSALEGALTDLLTPPVLRHLPEPLHLTDDIAHWIDARQAEADIHLVQTKNGTLIGLLILAATGETPPDIHIGYLFGEAHWSRGYATELLQGLVTHLPRPVRLLAGVEPDNTASIRVLERVGFIRGDADGLYALRLGDVGSA